MNFPIKKIPRRDRERQIWIDKQMAMDLEMIKAQKMLIGKPVRSIGQLTKEMRKTPSWGKVLRELLNTNQKPRIKIDKKRIT